MSDASSPAVTAEGAFPRFKARGRARITNGTDFLPTVDGRSIWARHARERMRALISHCGGEVTVTQEMLCRRAAVLDAECIYFEDHFAALRDAGEMPDLREIALYSSLANAQRRLCNDIGLARRARPIEPTLSQILNEADEDSDHG